MSIASLSRIAAVSSLSLLAACTQTPSTISLDEERVSRCPLELARGQTVLINLRSNPTTGFRWQVQDAAPGVLRSLGPEFLEPGMHFFQGAGCNQCNQFCNQSPPGWFSWATSIRRA